MQLQPGLAASKPVPRAKSDSQDGLQSAKDGLQGLALLAKEQVLQRGRLVQRRVVAGIAQRLQTAAAAAGWTLLGLVARQQRQEARRPDRHPEAVASTSTPHPHRHALQDISCVAQ